MVIPFAGVNDDNRKLKCTVFTFTSIKSMYVLSAEVGINLIKDINLYENSSSINISVHTVMSYRRCLTFEI